MKPLPFLLVALVVGIGANVQSWDTIQLAQNTAQKASFICKYGDTKRMELHTNGRIYTFKHGLEDGAYVAYYDKKLKKDTALFVVIKNGAINGLLQRWDSKDNKLAEECEYKDGRMDGYRKLYYHADGVKYINIDYWEQGIHQKTIRKVW